MNGRRSRVWLCLFGTLVLLSIQVAGGNTYMNDFPNVEVSEPNCYSFDITVSQGSGTTATLTVRVHDVDEESGELDEVYINNVFLGYLSGTNDTWSTSSFDVSAHVIYGGANTIRVCIDPDGGEATTWRAELDWGQILIDGGGAEDAEITSLSASGDWNAIQVQTGVSATNADTYRLEINLLDSLGNNKDISVTTFSMGAGASTTRYDTVSLPAEPSGGETFTIEALLFNHTTGVQQSIETTTWAASSEPPTDIALSSASVDENLPALTVVGTLSAVDPDSVSHQFALVGGEIGSFTISGTSLQTSTLFDFESQESYSIQIEAEDPDENVYSEWFTITINNVNEAPVASDDTFDVVEGTVVTLAPLQNDSDPESDPLSIDSITQPSQGTAVLLPDDSVEYTPDPGACGIDSFTYTASDGRGETSGATVTVTLQNQAPISADDVATVPESESVLILVLANDNDPGAGTLTLQSVGAPSFGAATIEGDSIRYTPRVRYEGEDRFSYTVSDPCGATTTGWVDVDVLHTNTPPQANAGSFYQGVVGEPLILDGSFSHDPDIGDFLQYRWDLNGSGIPNTDWLTVPTYTAIYHAPFFGEVTLEVRDVYRGSPTGEISTATALVRIASEQSIQVFVFEDLNDNGALDAGEYGLPGIDVDIDGSSYITEADGGIGVELDVGSWDVSLPERSILALESRGFTPSLTAQRVHLGASAIETVALAVNKTSTRLKGVVFSDANANGEWDDGDRLVPGLIVVLDGDVDNPTVTDEAGAFAFRDVAFGEHTLLIQEIVEDAEADEDPLNLLVPITLSRTDRTDLAIAWPYDLGPESGFLHVDVEQGEGGRP